MLLRFLTALLASVSLVISLATAGPADAQLAQLGAGKRASIVIQNPPGDHPKPRYRVSLRVPQGMTINWFKGRVSSIDIVEPCEVSMIVSFHGDWMYGKNLKDAIRKQGTLFAGTELVATGKARPGARWVESFNPKPELGRVYSALSERVTAKIPEGGGQLQYWGFSFNDKKSCLKPRAVRQLLRSVDIRRVRTKH